MKVSLFIFLTVFSVFTNRLFAASAQPDSLDYALYDAVFSINDTTESIALANVEKLLKAGANPNIILIISSQVRKIGSYIPIVKAFYRHKYRTYYSHTTSMHAAAATKNIKMMTMLLNHGGKPDTPDGDGFLPINLALSQDDIKMVNLLLDHGSDINKLDLKYTTNTTTIKEFVARGSNPETIDINYALGNTVLLQQLFDLGAGPNTHPLDFEKILKTPGLLDFLIKHGFDVNSSGAHPESSPLIFAAIKYSPVDTLKKIVRAGANIFVQDSYGSNTPLTIAIQYENIGAVKFLLESGCSANEKDWTGEPAIFKAIETDNDSILKLLIAHDADLEYLSHFGQTPLMKAAQQKKFIAVKTLVEAGANINASDNYGETALIIAIKEKDLPIIQYLVEHGAETKIVYESKTLPELAKSEECPPAIISYLERLK